MGLLGRSASALSAWTVLSVAWQVKGGCWTVQRFHQHAPCVRMTQDAEDQEQAGPVRAPIPPKGFGSDATGRATSGSGGKMCAEVVKPVLSPESLVGISDVEWCAEDATAHGLFQIGCEFFGSRKKPGVR